MQIVFSHGNRVVNKCDGLLDFRLLDWFTTAYMAAVGTISCKEGSSCQFDPAGMALDCREDY